MEYPEKSVKKLDEMVENVMNEGHHHDKVRGVLVGRNRRSSELDNAEDQLFLKYFSEDSTTKTIVSSINEAGFHLDQIRNTLSELKQGYQRPKGRNVYLNPAISLLFQLEATLAKRNSKWDDLLQNGKLPLVVDYNDKVLATIALPIENKTILEVMKVFNLVSNHLFFGRRLVNAGGNLDLKLEKIEIQGKLFDILKLLKNNMRQTRSFSQISTYSTQSTTTTKSTTTSTKPTTTTTSTTTRTAKSTAITTRSTAATTKPTTTKVTTTTTKPATIKSTTTTTTKLTHETAEYWQKVAKDAYIEAVTPVSDEQIMEEMLATILLLAKKHDPPLALMLKKALLG